MKKNQQFPRRGGGEEECSSVKIIEHWRRSLNGSMIEIMFITILQMLNCQVLKNGWLY